MAFPCEIWIAIDVACCTASEGIQKFFKTFNLVLGGLPTVTIFKKTFWNSKSAFRLWLFLLTDGSLVYIRLLQSGTQTIKPPTSFAVNFQLDFFTTYFWTRSGLIENSHIFQGLLSLKWNPGKDSTLLKIFCATMGLNELKLKKKIKVFK